MADAKLMTAEEMYKKDPNLKKEDVAHLRDWVSKQAHLPQVKEEFLILFLHSCYYSLEKAKKAIDSYYSIKTHAPEIFGNRNPELPEIQKLWKITQIAMLPKKNKDGHRVYLARIIDTDLPSFDWAVGMKVYIMNIHMTLMEEGPDEGYQFVFDMANLTLGHLTKLSISHLKKFLAYVQQGQPVRMKAVHVINSNSLIDKVMFLIKPFMSKEFLDLIVFHPGVPKEFLDIVPKSILPKEFGGEEISFADLTQACMKKQLTFKNFFLEDDKLVVDESKRTGGSMNEGTLFGVEGSFKKLSID